jgi:predicted nucleotidyltransferase
MGLPRAGLDGWILVLGRQIPTQISLVLRKQSADIAGYKLDITMKPSILLEKHRDQVREILQRFRMENPRIFGSAARGEDTEQSDLDILVDVPPGTSLYDLAGVEIELEALLGCKVEVLTKGFLAPDVAEQTEADLVPIP